MENSLRDVLDGYIRYYNKFPTRRELRSLGINEAYIYKTFGSIKGLSDWYDVSTKKTVKFPTTLVIPDAHVSPDQDLTRFKLLNKLILDKKPDNIIFMGDFITLESLSNWDLNKAGVMEGRRYYQDIACGKDALAYTLAGVKETYNPNVIFLMGNHEERLTRYVETKPELGEHLNIIKDLELYQLGINTVVQYRDYYSIEGVDFTHTPMNAANQPVAGKFAIHRASEMTNNSLVFGHTHRKECVNFYRHGADDIIQTTMCGAFFEHTDSYAYGGLNAYWRGCMILNHWKYGRYDIEELSLERMYQLY